MLFGNEKPNGYDVIDNYFIIISCSKNLKKAIEESKHFINLVKSKYKIRGVIEIIATKTHRQIFINDELMVLKGVDGKTEKWKITKIYPIDKLVKLSTQEKMDKGLIIRELILSKLSLLVFQV